MNGCAASLTILLRDSKHAVVIGVNAGDIAAALATARLLEFSGLRSTLGGLSWERNVYALTLFIATGKLYDTLATRSSRAPELVPRPSRPIQCSPVNATELDYQRKTYQAALTK